MNAEIIAIGSELLTPFRQDTNSLYLTEKLNQLGVEVIFKTVVGDNPAHLTQAASLALSRADIVIFIGGLGPTEDDVTRECVAEALGLALHRDPQIVAAIEQRFATRGWKMSANNVKQADVISGATVLPNTAGTASGQWISGKYAGKDKIVLLLPGPPFELKAVFDQHCMERLRAKLPSQFIATRVLKITGVGESQCDSRVAPIYTRHTDVQTTILAGAGEVQLHLKCRGSSLDSAQQSVDDLAGKLEEELGDLVFSDNGESLEQIVLYYLGLRQATLAVAESCTGGMVAERITGVPGSSRSFLGGAVVYSDPLKTTFANVPPELIAKHGAVSSEVASALAEGIRKRTGATLGLGVTGIAGPTGGTDEKPVGLVYFAVSDAHKTDSFDRTFRGDRDRVRHWATQQALDLIQLLKLDY